MQKRITIFDTIRGFTMLSMAGFHACYDLAYLYGWDMPWFTETVFQDIWRARPIPSRRSQSSVGMPYRSTYSISLSF